MFLFIILVLFVLLLAAAGGVLGWFAWQSHRMASRLGRPLSRIGKLRSGLRKVRGTIAAIGAPLRSPVTNRPCVYYRLRVYEDKTREGGIDGATVSGAVTAAALGGALGVMIYTTASNTNSRSSYSWRPLLDDDMRIPLAVEDETGGVEVDLRDATIVPKEKSRIVSNMTHQAPSPLAEMIREEFDIHQVDDHGRVRTLHYVEEALIVGAKVTVVGRVEPLKSGALCFEKTSEGLLVSERSIEKEARAARNRAIGLGVGGGASLAVALVFAVVALLYLARGMLGK